MRRMLAVSVVVLVFGHGHAGEPEVFYTRAEAVDTTHGEVELQRAYVKQLELPAVDCTGEPFTCARDLIYAQVYTLRFFEIHESLVGGRTTTERRDRGRLILASNFSTDDEEAFDRDLLAHLERLSSAAYSRNRAGLAYMAPPFEFSTLARSTLPFWLCEEDGGHYRFDWVSPSKASRSGADLLAERACKPILAAAEDSPPERFSTSPDIHSLIRREVLLETGSTVSGLTWSDELAPLPEGAEFTKGQGAKTGGMRDRQGLSYRGREGRFHDIQRDVLLPPASLQLLEQPMWVTRWTFSSVRESFGFDGTMVRESPVSITMAVLPIADPLMPALSRPRTPLTVPEAALLEEVREQVEKNAELDPTLIPRAFSRPDLWPSSGDWMLVSCYSDGETRYGVAPFQIATEVTNAVEACAAITREIGD